METLNTTNRLKELRQKVIDWHMFYRMNINRFHESRNYVFKSTLTEQQRIALSNIQRPPFEFNTIESYLSRLVGEYAKQEPSLEVHPTPDAPQLDPLMPAVIEGHLLAKFDELKKSGQQTQIYKDQLSGGWGCYKVYYDYANEYTFNQEIFIKCVEPTMVGFDPMARDLTKCDGEYCFEIFPMKQDEFQRLYPNAKIENSTHSQLADFTWTYNEGREKYVLLCDFYEKHYTTKSLVYLADNSSMLEKDYNKQLKDWESQGRLDIPPQVVKRRKIQECAIHRTVFIHNEIVEEEDTLYTHLPYVFVHGNSFRGRGGASSSSEMEYTRPLFYQARNMQDLKNLAGQALANEIESISPPRFIAPLEGIPEQYQDPYRNIQKPATLVYRAFMEDGITQIPAPSPVSRQPIPQEIIQTFSMCDSGIENILGAVNPNLGINQNELSGVALIEAISQSNSSSMPYIVNNLISLNKVGEIIIDLMPKVYTNPRTLSVINKQRKRTYVPLNGFGPESLSMSYSAKSLQLTVQAGVNFEVQKNRSIQYLAMLSQQFPALAQLINTQGLTVLLDNLDFRGADQLKSLAEQMQQQAAQQQNQQPPQIDPASVKMMDIQMRGQQHQVNAGLQAQKLQNEKEKNIMDFISNQQDHQVQLTKAQTERDVHAAKLHGEHLDRMHGQSSDMKDHEREDARLMKELAQMIQAQSQGLEEQE